MWKRNVAIGLTITLAALTVFIGLTNMKQQSRLKDLEALRNTTTQQVETEIARYLTANGVSLVNAAASENGIDLEAMINSALSELITIDENGNPTVAMTLTDEQIKSIAAEVAGSTYNALSNEVLSGAATIDVAKLENEVATAVTKALATNLSSMEKEYVTVEGNTAEIVAQVLAKVNASINISSSNNNGNTASSGLTDAQIEELVKKLVKDSYVTSDTVNSYKDSIVNETVKYLTTNKLISPGEDGKDGVDGKTPVKGTDYFTTEDVEKLKEDISNALKSATGLTVYGYQGTSISEAALNKDGDLVLTLESTEYDANTNQDVAVYEDVTVEDIAGNSIVYIKTVEGKGENAGTYKIVYYTRYRVANDDNGVLCCVDENYNEVAEGTAAEHLASHEGHTVCYRYDAGTATIDGEAVAKYVTEAMDTLVDSLQSQLGNNTALVQESIDALQKDIDLVTNYINGGEVTDENGNVSSVSGLDVFTTTDENSENYEGSFAWVLQQINKASGDVTYAEELEKLVEKDLGSYSTKSDIISFKISDLTKAANGYYTVTKGYEGVNARPGFSLVGSNTDDTVIPELTMAEAWSYCKFIETSVGNDGKTDVTFYFVDSDDAALSQMGSQNIYVEFTQVGIESDDNAAILTNQTHNNYGTVRVQSANDGTIILTGPSVEYYGGNNDELVIGNNN